MDEARDRLGAARLAADAGFASSAVSAAYYAILYAARAALSEEDRNAKTHRGTWSLFRETFVARGSFDADLLRVAERRQEQREAADYEARTIPDADAASALADAEQFVAAVERMLGG